MLMAWALLQQLHFYILRRSRVCANIWLGRRIRHPSSLNLPHVRLTGSLRSDVAQLPALIMRLLEWTRLLLACLELLAASVFATGVPLCLDISCRCFLILVGEVEVIIILVTFYREPMMANLFLARTSMTGAVRLEVRTSWYSAPVAVRLLWVLRKSMAPLGTPIRSVVLTGSMCMWRDSSVSEGSMAVGLLVNATSAKLANCPFPFEHGQLQHLHGQRLHRRCTTRIVDVRSEPAERWL